MSLRYRQRIMRVTLALLLTVVPTALLAHGALKSSSPARNARLTQLPRVLRLTFTEKVELSVARVILVRDGRDTVPLAPLAADSGGRILVAALAAATGANGASNNQSGTYTIHWLITGQDGHPVRGVIPFLVVAASDSANRSESDTSSTGVSRAGDRGVMDSAAMTTMPQGEAPGEAGNGFVAETFALNGVLQTFARWIGFAAVLAVIGTVVSLLAVAPSLARQGRSSFALALRSRALWAGLVAAAVLAAIEVGQLVLQHRSLTINGASLSYGALLGTTTWGMAWLVRSQSVVGLLLALLLARRARGVWYGLALAIAATALAGITAGTSLGGHAASVVPRVPAVLTDMVHLLSVGTWIGTLGLLLVVALPLLRSDASTALIAVRAFSRVAMVAVALMLLTGVVSASRHLGSWNAVFESTYGRVLLGKLAVVFIVLAIGARNQLRVRNDGVSATERISSISSLGRVELIFAIIVLLVTAVLVATPTPPTALH